MPWHDVKPQCRGAKALRFLGVWAAFWLALITPASSADVSDLPAPLVEKIEAAQQAGFEALALGPRVLRTETAPLAAIAILQSRWGDM